MSKHLIFVAGIVFATLALTLGVMYDNPTPLETRLQIGAWALAAGGIATAVPSTLGVEWDFSKKIAAGIAGAIIAFVILSLLIKIK